MYAGKHSDNICCAQIKVYSNHKKQKNNNKWIELDKVTTLTQMKGVIISTVDHTKTSVATTVDRPPPLPSLIYLYLQT